MSYLIYTILLLFGIIVSVYGKSEENLINYNIYCNEDTVSFAIKSCEEGDGSKCYQIGKIYAEGLCVRRNEVKANYFYKKSCDLSQDQEACENSKLKLTSSQFLKYGYAIIDNNVLLYSGDYLYDKTLLNDIKDAKSVYFSPCDLSQYDVKKYINIKPKIACSHLPGEGMFVYLTRRGLFSDDRDEAIGLFGADELQEPLKVTQKITQRMIENYMDVMAIYPEIPLPKSLPQLFLEKSQFEKEADFQQRKAQALAKREEEQKKLNEEYIEAVKSRNLSIFKELERRKIALKDKIIEFRKRAFMAVSTPPAFEFSNYDAESEKLYGKFLFGSDDYKVVASNVSPELAKSIYEKSKTITPQSNYELIENGDTAVFQTKELILSVGSKELRFDYTDKRYEPSVMKFIIPSYDISAFNTGITEANKEAAAMNSEALKALQDLERYRVKSQFTISDTVIHRVNAKAPSWYENPNCGQEKCAVGRGETQSEALKVALAQLGCIVKSSTASELVVQKVVTDNINEQKKIIHTIQQTCSNTLDEGSLNVTNTAELDGWYYVRTVLDNNKI